MQKVIRLSKILSHSGVCSRREAETLIKKGDVRINNEVFKEFSIDMELIKSISVKGKQLTKSDTRVWCFYKPKGYVSSNKEQFNQKSLFRLIPKNLPRVISVGRLDINSEGLMILTNNPSFSNFLERPENEISRIYEVKVYGKFSDDLISRAKKLKIDNIYYKSIFIKKLFSKNLFHKLSIELTEGKNREIRKVMEFFSLKVLKLKRINYGPFKLNTLKKSQINEIEKKDLNVICEKLGFKNENYFW